MIRSDAVNRIQDLLGHTTAHTAKIQNALIDAQIELEQEPFLPWFLLTSGTPPTDLLTVAAQRHVTHPAGFLRESEEDGLYYVNANGAEFELEKHEFDHLVRVFQTASGTPKAYANGLASFFIFPLADATYTIRLNRYYKADTILSSDVTNQWLTYAHELLIGRAGMKIAPGLRDATGTLIFEKMATSGLARLIRGGEAREHENRRYIMGGAN